MDNLRNMFLGICEITDGLIRLLSLGYIHTKFAMSWLVWWEVKMVLPKELERLKNGR